MTFSLSDAQLLYLLQATKWTLLLSAIAFAGGSLCGLILALARVSSNRVISWSALLFIQAVQGTPLLILLFLAYFGLGMVGADVSPLMAASVSLTIYSGAFLGEIWRGCIQAIPKAQWEAAECLGLTPSNQYAYVILPQAIRIAVPPTVGFLVQIVKNTSLTSIIGFVELTRASQVINNSIFSPFLVYGVAALIYFSICYPLSLSSRHLEKRLNVQSR